MTLIHNSLQFPNFRRNYSTFKQKQITQKLSYNLEEIPDLDNGHLTSEHQNDTHLEENSEGVTNVIGIELLEALSAVPALKKKRVAHGGLTNTLL